MSALISPTELWRRRTAYLEQGRSIVLSLIPVEHVLLWGNFCDDMGLDGDQVVSSIMCPLPVPVPPTPRRRPKAKADMLWHPFVWLPPHMTTRRDEDEAEDHDLYVLRVALEIEATGLYDRRTGTWLDVCSTVGVDLDQPDDLARAQAWLDGEPDPSLDDIDLTDWTRDPQTPNWANDVAAFNFQLWLEAVWSESASAQAETLSELLGSSGQEPEEVQEYVRSIAGISATWFRRVPALGSSRLPGRPADAFSAIEYRLRALNLSERELRGEIVPALMDAFKVIAGIFRPAVDEMLAGAEEEEEEDEEEGKLLAFPSADTLLSQ